ncbi:MAG: hypothetical protein FWF59_12050 [Turicibacter sp.]|nr:hypothetical protein [Turicibacter sp.]
MIIESLEVTSNFQYLWLKKVVDVDLTKHCAKCLIGTYSDHVNAKDKSFHDIELPDGIYYLCGVAYPYRYENNFHLAFRPRKGHTIDYTDNGIHVIIKDAWGLPFSTDDVSPFLSNGEPCKTYDKKTYYTCRNYQFAHLFDKQLR